MSADSLDDMLQAAKRAGWGVHKFGPSGASLRLSNGSDEIVVHFYKSDARMRSAFWNGKKITGGLRRITEIIKESKK